MRTLLWTILRINPALFAAYVIAFLSGLVALAGGEGRWAAIFAILGFIALGIETKFRNPAAVALRQLRPRKRRVIQPRDPSHN